MDSTEALAEAWASIDGNLDKFRAGKTAPNIEDFGGHYAGYMVEAEEMIRRLATRGYWLAPMEPSHELLVAGWPIGLNMITRDQLEDSIARRIAAYNDQAPRDTDLSRADKLRDALVMAREKLVVYRQHSGGQYQGGMEHTALIEMIDKALAEP